VLHFVEEFVNEKKLAKNFSYVILAISTLSLFIFVFFRNQTIWLGVALGALTIAAILAFLALLYSAFSKHSLTLKSENIKKYCVD
jgi:hypothetical protein